MEALIRAEIEECGPILFSRFMELALYHPQGGYYRRPADPFGKEGDFYTAAQLQPVFGRLVAALFEEWVRELELDTPALVVDLGAGREEMREALSARFRYQPIQYGDALPLHLRGLIFANEFFDALPVDVVENHGGELRYVRVKHDGRRFLWIVAEPLDAAAVELVKRSAGVLAEGARIEVSPRAVEWLHRMAIQLEYGRVLIIDYGYSRREAVRFPSGTLMSYRRHRASEDVLTAPGEQDITAHVPLTLLKEEAERCGLRVVSEESLAMLLARSGERDQFAGALAAESESEVRRLRLQLKTLLYGLGDVFRAMVLEKR